MPYKKNLPAKKKMNPRVPAPVKKYVNSVVAKNEETKHNQFSPQNTGFTAGNIYTLNPLQNITTGNTLTTRVGDQIRLQSMHFRGAFRNETDKPANVRIIVTKTREELSTTVENFISGLLGQNTLLLGTSWYAPVDKARHTVLKDITIKIPANQLSNQQNDRLFNVKQYFRYPMFRFQRGSSRGSTGDILFHVLPIDQDVKFDEASSFTTFYKDA